jgi:hypothetical protein
MFLDTYYKEKALYERRLQLLDILDDFARNAFYDEDYTMKEDDPKMIILRKQFADVLNPVNVEDKLKRIYPEHLYRETVLKCSK